jgi:hypothetical protein
MVEVERYQSKTLKSTPDLTIGKNTERPINMREKEEY